MTINGQWTLYDTDSNEDNDDERDNEVLGDTDNGSKGQGRMNE
jgi:hypothetical protein